MSARQRRRTTRRTAAVPEGGGGKDTEEAAKKAAKAKKGKKGKKAKPETGAQRGRKKKATPRNITTSRKSGRKRVRPARVMKPTKDKDGGPPDRNDPEPIGPHKFGKYVYCVIRTQKPLEFGAIGLGADPPQVHTVGYRDIAAVVSDTFIEVHDPTRQNVLAHERVNEHVMETHTAIPMSFGTVFKTADDIVELLRSAYSAFREVLVKMEGKLEFGIKVLWDPDEIIAELEHEDENLGRLRDQISSDRGSTYFARIQYGRLVERLLEERAEGYSAAIFGGLRDVAVASRSNKPIGERMIMNGAFLVERDREADFDQRVKQIAGTHPELTFKYTGPWPPYNFVNIRLKLERAENGK